MFEKLKNLIFEDDPEDYEDEEEEVIPVRKPKEKVQKTNTLRRNSLWSIVLF